MNAWSPRSRVLDVFAGRRPQAVPWFADLTYWYSGRKIWGTLPARYAQEEGRAPLQIHRDTGAGICFYAPTVFKEERDPALFGLEKQVEGDLTITTVRTPEGRLRLVEKQVSDGSKAPIEWAVQSLRELKILEAYWTAATYSPNYEAYLAADREWGESGIAVALTGRNPVAALAATWSGIENLSYLLADERKEVEASIEAMQRSSCKLYEVIAGSPAHLIEITDNLTAEAVGGLFRRYCFDFYSEQIALLHRSGKKVGVHIDGTLHGLLELLPKTGLDFAEAVTPAPVGDMTARQIREAVGSEFIIWGGIPGAMFLTCSWEEMRTHIQEVIFELGREGRLVLGVADQVPPGADLDWVRRITGEVDTLGGEAFAA
jgi:hypothetical protein